MRRITTGAVLGLVLAFAVAPVFAVTIRPGFDTSNLPANDDSSTGQVAIGFTINFFGSTWTDLYCNNNGNLTFSGPMWTYTPFPLTGQDTIIIAPFFADVDTRPGGSDLLRYGQGTVDSHAAFGATWDGVGVGYFSYGDNLLNKFQVVLIDRSDIAAGDFDFEFNYDQIQWETGSASGGSGGFGGDSARAGYSNGVSGAGERSYELPGSAVNGALLDGGPNALILQTNVHDPGRLVFEVRSGQVTPLVPEPLTMTACLMGLAAVGLKLRRRLA